MAAPLLRIAARNVRKNWRHGIGSLLAVAVGFVAIGLFDGYLTYFQREIGAMMEERFMMGVLVERAGASEVIATMQPDPLELGEREQAFVDEYLRDRSDEVAARARMLFVWGYASTGRASTHFTGWGYDPEGGAALRRRFAWDALAGKPLHLAGPDSAMLAKSMGALLDCVPASDRPATGKDGLPIAEERPFTCRRPRVQLMASTTSGQVNAVEPTVVGLVDAGRKEMDVKFVALPLSLAQRLRNTRDVSLYSVLLRDPSRAAAFSRDLVAAARERGFALDAMPWQDHVLGEQYKHGMQVFAVFRGLMAIVVSAIAGMAVFTTMVKSVSERTREIGTLRSLGFLRRQVLRLFAIEAALLASAASCVGLAVTLVVTAAVNGAGVTYKAGLLSEPIPLRIAVDPRSWILTAGFLVAVAVLAALLPARRAARARIPDALAYA